MRAIKSPSNTLVIYQKTELGTHLLNHTTFPQIPDPKDKNMKSQAHSDETTGDNKRKVTKLIKVLSLKWQQETCLAFLSFQRCIDVPNILEAFIVSVMQHGK